MAGRFRNIDSGEMPYADRAPGHNGDPRSYMPFRQRRDYGQWQSRDHNPNHDVRGPRSHSGAMEFRDQTKIKSQVSSETTRPNADSRPLRPNPMLQATRPNGPVSNQGDVVENVVGEVLKIIDNQAYIFCKIINKSGQSDFFCAKYYPLDKRNFESKVKIRDLQIGSLVRISLAYNEFKRNWDAFSLKLEAIPPESYETDTNPSSFQQYPVKVVPDKLSIQDRPSKTQTGRASNSEEMTKSQVSSQEQNKPGSARVMPQRWNNNWKQFQPSSRRQSDKGSLNPKSEVFVPQAQRPPLSPVKPMVKRYAPEMVMYNQSAIIKPGPKPRLEFMDERQKVALDLTEDLEVEFKRFGEVFDKKIVLEDVVGRESDVIVHIDVSKKDQIWTLKQVHLPTNYITKSENPYLVQPVLDALVDGACAIQVGTPNVDDASSKIENPNDDANLKIENPSDNTNDDRLQAMDIGVSSEVVPKVLDQVPESCDPCDSLAESKPEFDEGLKSGPDQIEPALDSKDRLFDLVTIGENLPSDVIDGSETVVQSMRPSEIDFPLDEDVFCEVPILEPAILDVSVGAESATKDSTELIAHVSATEPVVGNPLAQAVESPMEPNPAVVDVNPTCQDTSGASSGLEKTDADILKNFLQFVANSKNPKALLEAFMKNQE